MIREDNVELFVRRFQLGHPEGFVDLHFGSRISIRFATVATHHEFTGRDTDEIDFHSRSDFNHLTGFLLLSQHFLDPVGTERPTFHLQVLFLYRSSLFRHYRGDRTLLLQIVGIVGDFLLPIDTGSVRIFVGQFLTTLDLVESFIRKHRQDIRVEVTFVGSIIVDPVVKRLPFLVGQLHVVVAFFQQADEFARVRMIFIRLQNNHIAFTSLTVHIRMQVQVGSTIAPIIFLTTTQVERFSFTVMTGDTSAIQDRLHFQVERERTSATFGQRQGRRSFLRSNHTLRDRDLVLVFVATDTGNHFTGLTGHPATHPLDSHAVFVQRLDGYRSVGRSFEDHGTVFFDRNRTQHTFDIPTGLDSVPVMVGASLHIRIFVSMQTQ